MIKKYLGLSLITASMLVMGCSSDDDGPAATTGTTDGMEEVLVVVPADVMLPDGVEAPTLNIVETAVNTPTLSSLVAAVTRANLADTLGSADSTFTVFAPSDAAFAALPAGTVDNMSDEDLAALLQYHVVSGALDGAGVAAGAGMSVATLQGGNLPIVADADGNLSIGGAPISATDIYTTNGIVHVIDMVLIPPAGMTDGMTDGQTDGMTDGQTDGMTDGTTGGVGSVEQLMIDNGNLGGYLTGLATTVNVQSFEEEAGLAWTVFAPTDAALAGATVDNTIVQDSISTLGAYDPATLGARSEVTTNQGKSYPVVNNAGAITVGGFAVTLINSGTAVVYAIDGVLN